MQCITGYELYRQYEIAETEKNVIKGKRPPMTGGPNLSDKEFLAAKQRYLESFANWLSHKAFCHDCRPKS